MRPIQTVVVMGFLLAATAPGKAAMIYFNDFEGGAGPQWSHTATSLTPAGARRFLGQFANEQVRLSLAGLTEHVSVTLSLQLFTIASWDGNSDAPGDPDGDVWDLSVVGGPTLLHTTFGINDGDPSLDPRRQAFPGNYPGGSYLFQTGASEIDTLGYLFWDTKADAVYELQYTFAHSASDLTLQFSGIGLKSLADESWGIDNVAVSLNSVPEPSALAHFVAFALFLLANERRKRRRPSSGLAKKPSPLPHLTGDTPVAPGTRSAGTPRVFDSVLPTYTHVHTRKFVSATRTNKGSCG